MSGVCANPEPLSAADQALHEMFAETAILLTHKDPERAAMAKARVYELLFDTRSPAIEKLEQDNARLREALEDVCAPVNYLRKYAERKGRELDGSAYVIANDLAFVQGIARSALNPHEGEKG